MKTNINVLLLLDIHNKNTFSDFFCKYSLIKLDKVN